MAKTQPAETLAIRITTKNDNGFFHIIGTFVTLGSTLAQRLAFDRGELTKLPTSDEVRPVNNNYGALTRGLRLEHLQITSQAFNGSSLGSFDVVYTDSYIIDREMAGHMSKTLETLHRRTGALRDKFGAVKTFGQYVAYLAEAVGVSHLVFDKVDRVTQAEPQVLRSVRDGIAKLDYLEQKYVEANAPKEVAS